MHVLIVEDTENDAALIQHTLRRAGYKFTCKVVDTPAAMRAELENQDWDVIISDHSVPMFNAPAALALAQELRPDVPLIIVSSEIDLNLAISLMRGGAKDYIQKRELPLLIPTIERELRETELRRKRRQMDAALLESEEHYRLLFQSIDSGFALHEIICDEQGVPCDYRFLEINPAFEKLTGLRADTLIGHTDMEMLPGTEKEWIERYGKVALTGEVAHFENYSRELGKFYEVTAYSPKHGQFAVIFQDVTERRRSEEARRERDEWHRVVLQTAMDGFWMVDLQGHLIEVNEALCRMSGYSAQELLGMRINDLESGETADQTAARIQKIMTEGQERFEARHRRKDGSVYDVEVSAQYRADGGGWIVAFLRDISDRKQAENKINEQLEELRRWHNITLGREDRILELKNEINKLLEQTGKPPRYASAQFTKPD